MERKLYTDDKLIVTYKCQYCRADLVVKLSKFNTPDPKIDEEKINKVVMHCPVCGGDMGKAISVAVELKEKAPG